MTAEVIRCVAATRRYRSAGLAAVTAVDRVDLVVGQGETIAVQGPSGSGKTTLLGLISGLELADDGSVFVLGHDLARLSAVERARLRRLRMGLVFQSYGLLPSLTAGENVALPLALAGMAESTRASHAEALLAAVGLARAADRRIDELSTGERQRVGVARALVGEPDIVLADEPTGNLDDDTGHHVLALVRELTRERGSALVLVTHDPASAAQTDRTYRMQDGRIAQGATR